MRNSVYSLVNWNTQENYKPLFGETYEGCYKDKRKRARDLPKRLKTNGTPKDCLNQAIEKGYKYAGL